MTSTRETLYCIQDTVTGTRDTLYCIQDTVTGTRDTLYLYCILDTVTSATDALYCIQDTVTVTGTRERKRFLVGVGTPSHYRSVSHFEPGSTVQEMHGAKLQARK